MDIEKRARQDKLWAVVIGTGLALSPIHNLWLTNLATNSKGEVLFFLPSFGYLILIMGAGLYLVRNWEAIKKAGWGDKKIIVSLLIIVASMGLSGLVNGGSLGDRISPLFAGLSFFALYLTARVLGKDIFLPLMVGAVIASLGVIAYGVVYPGVVTGGFIFEGNYDIVVGYILMGAVLCQGKYQWLLVSLALVAILMSGSPEGVFAIGMLGLVVLVRRDWGKKLAMAVAPVVVIGALLFIGGYGQALYAYIWQVAQQQPSVGLDGMSALGYRWHIIQSAVSNLKPFGEGYVLTAFSLRPNVHNVPLVIVQQLGWAGILAAGAWVFTGVYCLVRTQWKYVLVSVFVLSVFDHYIWTQLAPLWWAIIGVSTASRIGDDRIFNREETAEYL